MAVLPYESEVLTLYKSSAVSNAAILALQFFVLGYAVYIILKKKPFSDGEVKMLIRYTAYFVFIGLLNALATFFSAGNLGFDVIKTIAVRSMSMVCIWSFYVCCIYWSKDDRIYAGISSAGVTLMALSAFSYIFFGKKALSLESTGVYVYRGVAGNRNSYVIFAFCFVAGAVILLHNRFAKTEGKIRTKIRKNILPLAVNAFICLFALVTVYLTKSATGLLLFVFLLALYFLFAIAGKKFPVWLIPVAYAAVWIVIGIVGIDRIIPKTFFEKVFHRSADLSYRTVLWDNAKKLSKYSIFTGFGFDNTYLADMHIVSANHGYINDPHNSVLYLILTQGILGFGAWLYMIVKPLSEAAKVKNDRKITYILIFISVMLLRGLVESVFQYTNMVLWAMVIALESETLRNGRKAGLE